MSFNSIEWILPNLFLQILLGLALPLSIPLNGFWSISIAPRGIGIWYTFNSIEWIRGQLLVHNLIIALTFNSIEWILIVRLTVEGNSIIVNFQFH